ncbi:hypothetical protein ACGFZR_15360 [Streptomyces sp. NPDC048241]|uniref:hypothetical protein n=1 Tax=Streptomyces sp. NPDC048241 TaxID=3365521 RepID=UPI00370FAFE0
MTQPDPTHGLSVQHADALWDAVAIPGPTRPSFMEQHARVCRAVAAILDETRAAVLPTPDQRAAEDLAATTCSAQYHGPGEDQARLCIRATQHTGKAHTDEHGFHWSDTVAMYPLADGRFRTGVNLQAELRRLAGEAQQDACPTPESHNWGCGCPTDQLPLHAESGIDTPGCDCGHEGMGPKWHGRDCSWLATMTVPHPDDVTGEAQQDEARCACGEPTAPGTVHRTDGPCYVREAQQDEPACAYPHGKPGIASLLEHVGVDTSGGVTVDGRAVAAPCTCGGHSIHHLLADSHQPVSEASQPQAAAEYERAFTIPPSPETGAYIHDRLAAREAQRQQAHAEGEHTFCRSDCDSEQQDTAEDGELEMIRSRFSGKPTIATADPAMCPRCKGDNSEPFELCAQCAAVAGSGQPDTEQEAVEVVHGCPPDGSGLTPCCGRTPFELPRGDRISSEAPTTCPGATDTSRA